METCPQIRAILLDMDGVIIDSETMYRIAWQRAASKIGYELSDELYAAFLGLTIPDAEAALGRAFGPQFPVAKFHETWPGDWRDLVKTHGMPVKPGLWNFLDVVNEHRLSVAVATSSDAEVAAFSLRAAGLDGRFSCIVSGDQVAKGKPAPDIFLEASRRLGVAPEACLVLEDSEAGLHAAKAAGMAAIMIPDLKQPSPEAAAIALRILPSLSEAADLIKEYSKETESIG